MSRPTSRFNSTPIPSPTPNNDHKSGKVETARGIFATTNGKTVGEEIAQATYDAIAAAERKHRKVA